MSCVGVKQEPEVPHVGDSQAIQVKLEPPECSLSPGNSDFVEVELTPWLSFIKVEQTQKVNEELMQCNVKHCVKEEEDAEKGELRRLVFS